MEAQNNATRVRKRAPNACVRCRQQKIRCSGSTPCQQCAKRNLPCVFDAQQNNVRVSREYIEDLQRRAQSGIGGGNQNTNLQAGPSNGMAGPGSSRNDEAQNVQQHNQQQMDAVGSSLERPQLPKTSLGTTSNRRFRQAVLTMTQQKISGTQPAENLFSQGLTYDIGWDGLRSNNNQDACILPTADFAEFLIHAVKFRCGQLFHLYDELDFLEQKNSFHEAGGDSSLCPPVWYVHYLLVLAFGKAFTARSESGRRPAGAELFSHAMKLLPDITFLCTEPLETVEVLCCAALYLHCLDSRSAAFNLIGQAMRISIEQGMHTDMQCPHLSEHTMERRREAFWTVYTLDRYISALMGSPITLSDEDITVSIPSFPGLEFKSIALGIYIKISQATAQIAPFISRQDHCTHESFRRGIQNALTTVLSTNDERNTYFSLDQEPGGGISRLSAYLHIFHHQCILLITRPLLFSLWKKRLESPASIPVRSQGVRSFLRVSINSSQQTLSILEKLESQDLLESFLPFDLDALTTSAIVLSLSAALDPSLLRSNGSWSQNIYVLLDKLIGRGNLIAKAHKSELRQLDEYLQRLGNLEVEEGEDEDLASEDLEMENQAGMGADQLGDGNSELELDGDQLIALARSWDFGRVEWLDPSLL